MRRTVAAAVALGTALSLSTLAGGSPAAGRSGRAASPTASTRAEAEHALRAAVHTLHGHADHTRRPGGTGATMALRDLRLSMPHLTGSDRERAAALLARPTDHPDPNGQTYAHPAQRACSRHICVHWISRTKYPNDPDRASGTFAHRILRMMNHVWGYEVGRLGYDAPVSDGTRGGGGYGRYDVYLKELYHQGLYGLTTADRPMAHDRRRWSAYLTLDNDFARSQYGAAPMSVARVTAAHEFFHAIQFGYDVREDAWLMESTATWMEDQFDDASNDNRQYLRYGQIAHPGTPLDTFEYDGFAQYGNWAFFEYLSERFGRGVVRSIWRHAAVFGKGDHLYSASAIRAALAHHGGMTQVFARYAGANTAPAQGYREGSHYPRSGFVARFSPSSTDPVVPWQSYRVKHLSSDDIRVTPGTGLPGRAWHLWVRVDGPHRAKMPAALVIVHRRSQPTTRTLMHLDGYGNGKLRVPFGSGAVRSVVVVLANTSTRFHDCFQGGQYSCQGYPGAPHPTFRLRLHVAHS